MKKHDLRNQSRILIEHILQKDPISANSVFQRLIMEAEEERENEVMDELGFDDETADSEDVATSTEVDDTFDTDGADEVDGLDNAETDKAIDDIIEINCQINAKRISNIFDKIAELKNQLEQAGLDETSKEYLKFDVSIQYYSDKLQDLQNKTNPGIDQGKVEEALDKIETAISELGGELGGSDTDENITDVDTPAEISAENDLETEPEETGEAAEETSEEDLNNEQPADETEETVETSEETEDTTETSEDTEKKAEEKENIEEIFK